MFREKMEICIWFVHWDKKKIQIVDQDAGRLFFKEFSSSFFFVK